MSKSRSVSSRVRWAAALLVVAMNSFVATSPASAADPVTISGLSTSPTGAFTPNGDGNGEESNFFGCLSAPANVTLEILDASGTETVFVAMLQQSLPSGCRWWASWDGVLGTGAIAADGEYALRATATDASNNTSTEQIPIIVETRFPGTLTAPAPSAEVAGDLAVVFTPTPGFTIGTNGVYAYLTGCSTSSPSYELTLQPDGTYTTTIDTIPCGEGPRTLSAYTTWIDALGNTHSYNTTERPLTLTNPIAPTVRFPQQTNATFSPNGDNREETAFFYVCTSEPTTITVELTDASGELLRTFATDERLNGNSNCINYWYNGGYRIFHWDGTTDTGATAPDGTYTVTVTATDDDDNTTTNNTTLTVDSRLPGTLTAPAPGVEVAGDLTVVFTPTPGITPSANGVYAALSGCSVSYELTLQPDGTYATVIDTVPCGEGPRSLSIDTSWIDVLGHLHFYNTGPQPLTLTNSIGPSIRFPERTTAAFSPNGDNREDTAFFYVCTSEPATITVELTDATGELVRTFATDEPIAGNSNCTDYWYYGDFQIFHWDGTTDTGTTAADGTYTVTVTATDDDDNTTTNTTTLTIDNRLPGTLTAPAPGAEVAGDLTVVWTPTPGITVGADGVWVYLSACDNNETGYRLTLQPDGTYTTTIDTVACGEGHRTVLAYTTWIDTLGQTHSYNTTEQSLILANSIAPTIRFPQQTAGTFSPNGDGHEDNAYFYLCTSERTTITVELTDATGQLLRTFAANEVHNGNRNCINYWYFGGYRTFEWDGTTDAGATAPDGTYTVTATATDSDGLTTTNTTTLTIDSRLPGTLTAPGPGSTLSGFAPFVFTPTPGFAIEQVEFVLNSRWFAVYNASADGTWRTTTPVGALPEGATTLFWSVRWTDVLGQAHTYSGTPFEVAIDPTAIPLEAVLDPADGEAPATKTLTVTTSEPNGLDVAVNVRWGDGSADETVQVAAPYAPVTLEHTFAEPGIYNVFVSAANAAGGYSSRTIRTEVTGPPNTAPVLTVAPDAVLAGVAPFDLTLPITATDAEGDALTVRADFGDGTTQESSPYPTDLEHRYPLPGTYLVRVSVTDGLLSAARTLMVTVALPEPLVANAGDDQRAFVGDTVTLSGVGSRPGSLITAYEWDFGDGTGETGTTTTHVFSEPGTYTVTLTTRLGTQTSTDTTVVVVEPVPVEPGLHVTVSTGDNPLPGADVTIVDPDGTRFTATTDGDGKAHLLGLADGTVTVYVWANGAQPVAVQANIVNGAGTLEVALTSGEVGAVELETTRLTVEQIIERGIDPTDPANVNVFETTVNLFFEPIGAAPEIVPVELIVTGNGITCWHDCGYLPSGSEGEPGPSAGSCDVTDPSGPCFILRGYTFTPTVQYVESKPIIQWLVLPVNASFLKEFFDVKLIVQNLTGDFTFEGGVAELTLPSGLSLAPTSTPQFSTVGMADIAPGSTGTVTWTVRGDTEGEWNASAVYTASAEPIGRVIRLEAATRHPIKVWGGSALKMIVEVDDEIHRWGPYEVWVTLQNISDIAVYNAQVEMEDQGEHDPQVEADYVISPLTPNIQSTPVIAAGEGFTAKYVVMAGVGNDEVTDLRNVLEESFIAQTGGNVTLATELRQKDATAFTGGRFDNLSYRLQQGTGGAPDEIVLRWTNPVAPDGLTVTGYEIYGREYTQRPAGWNFVGTASPSTNQTEYRIPSTMKNVGRYFVVATVYSDGSRQIHHNMATGPARYVAMGDSYSSGEGVPAEGGASQFFTGTGEDVSPVPVELVERFPFDNRCHRSFGAYSQLLVADRSLGVSLEPSAFVACSGAITRDFSTANPANEGEAPQLDSLSDFTDLVTLSVGGNDVDFGTVAKACLLKDCRVDLLGAQLYGTYGFTGWLDRTLRTIDDFNEAAGTIVDGATTCAAAAAPGAGVVLMVKCAWAARKAYLAANELLEYDAARQVSASFAFSGELRTRLIELYTEVATRAPNARVIVVPYPTLMGEGPSGTCDLTLLDGFGLNDGERTAVNQFTATLNAETRAAVAAVQGQFRNGISVADIDSSFAGKELCSGGELNPATAFNPIINPYFSWPGAHGPIEYSLHPNATGQSAYYEAVKATLEGSADRTVKLSRTAPTASVPLEVPSDQQLLVVRAYGAEVHPNVVLVTPSGSRLTPESPGVATNSVPGGTEFSVADPAQGEWQLEVTSDDEPTTNTSFQVHATTVAPTALSPTAGGTVEVLDRTTGLLRLTSTSTDPDGTIASTRWTLPDGSSVEGASVEATVGVGPQRYVSLVVTDDDGLTAYADLTIEDLTPPDRVVSIVIGEPDLSLEVGQMVQLHATGVQADGMTLDVTTAAAWTSGDPLIAAVSGGLVTATGTGQATVTATLGAATASINVTVTPVRTPPAAPTEITVTATETGLELGWQDVADNETGYEILRLEVDSAAGTSTTVASLSAAADATSAAEQLSTPGTFVYVVRAVNDRGASAWAVSPLIGFRTNPPDAPTDVDAQATDAAIEVTWLPGSDAGEGFEIWRLKVDPFTGDATVDLTTTQTDTTMTDAPTDPSVYVYVVRAVNRFGASGWGVSAPEPFGMDPPAAPTEAAAVSSPLGIEVSWSDASDDETSFDIWRLAVDSTTGAAVTEATLASPAGTATVTDTPPPGVYVYVVRATNRFGASSWAVTGVVQHLTDPPAAPTAVVATQTADGVTVGWADEATTETGFEIWRLAVDPVTGTADVQATATVAADTIEWTEPALPAGVYVYLVRSTNQFGASAWTLSEVLLAPQ